jgi:regulator of protease activity HflC (stomatin/prohibitin superfamily)
MGFFVKTITKTDYSGRTKEIKVYNFARIYACVIALFLAIGILSSCFIAIPTGYTGILTTFGKVHNETLESGFNLKAPWQKVIKMDNREQKVSFTINAFSSDIQQVSVVGSVNYNINKTTAMTLYKEVGTKYVDILVMPRLQENVKEVFARYTAEDLVANRDVLSKEIVELMVNDISDKGINIVTVAVEDIDFTDAFTEAIEAKQVATQNKLRAETEQAQRTYEAEEEANRKRIAVEAEANAKKIAADAEAYEIRIRAEAEAEANEKLASSLTDKIIEKMYYDKWNGELPMVVGSENNLLEIPMLSYEE